MVQVPFVCKVGNWNACLRAIRALGGPMLTYRSTKPYDFLILAESAGNYLVQIGIRILA